MQHILITAVRLVFRLEVASEGRSLGVKITTDYLGPQPLSSRFVLIYYLDMFEISNMSEVPQVYNRLIGTLVMCAHELEWFGIQVYIRVETRSRVPAQPRWPPAKS